MKLTAKIVLIIFAGLVVGVLWSFLVIIPEINSYLHTSNLEITEVSTTNLIRILMIFFAAIYPPAIIIVAYFIVRIILDPIKKMNKTVKEIASGFVANRIEVTSKDEIGELGSNINLIINNLVNSLQSTADSFSNIAKKDIQLEKNVRKLEEEKAKDDAILSSIGDGVVAVDKDGKIFMFNNAAVAISNFTASEVIGSSYQAILEFHIINTNYIVEEAQASSEFIKAALTGTNRQSAPHMFLVKKDKSHIPVTATAAPIFDQQKNILGAVVVFRDNTKSDELDRLKNDFVSVASHELRTPMTAINGLISMIMENDFGEVNPTLKEPLQDISIATRRLITLVNDLLNVSRIESGRLKLETTNFKLKPLAEMTLKLLEPLAKEKNVELKLNINSDLAILADINKVQEIINNLVGNALKFTDHGIISIEAQAQSGMVKIRVKDTGIGIAPEDQQKLFQKFQQLGSQERGRPIGTGLGLYISKEIAQKMGGDLTIQESILNKGSIFACTLPEGTPEPVGGKLSSTDSQPTG